MLPDWIVPVSSAITAIATCGVLFVAARQLPLLARQIRLDGERQRQWETVRACERFVTDPCLAEAKKNIFAAKGLARNGEIDDPMKIRRDVFVLLNYLDTLAIGVNQGVYIESIVKDHLKFIFQDAVERFARKEGNPFHVKVEHFNALLKLHDKWFVGDLEYLNNER